MKKITVFFFMIVIFSANFSFAQKQGNLSLFSGVQIYEMDEGKWNEAYFIGLRPSFDLHADEHWRFGAVAETFIVKCSVEEFDYSGEQYHFTGGPYFSYYKKNELGKELVLYGSSLFGSALVQDNDEDGFDGFRSKLQLYGRYDTSVGYLDIGGAWKGEFYVDGYFLERIHPNVGIGVGGGMTQYSWEREEARGVTVDQWEYLPRVYGVVQLRTDNETTEGWKDVGIDLRAGLMAGGVSNGQDPDNFGLFFSVMFSLGGFNLL